MSKPKIPNEAAMVAKELNKYCSKVNPKYIKICTDCKIFKQCKAFLSAIPNLHLAIVDANNGGGIERL